MTILFSINMGCGHSTNTRSKLMALWALLFVAKELGIPSLHVHGDSTTVINQVKGRVALSALNLEGWCQNIRNPESSFLSLLISFMFIENTMRRRMAYPRRHSLWPLATDHLYFIELFEGEIIGNGSFQLF